MNYIVAFLIHWMIREPEEIEVPHQRADCRRHSEDCNGNIDGNMYGIEKRTSNRPLDMASFWIQVLKARRLRATNVFRRGFRPTMNGFSNHVQARVYKVANRIVVPRSKQGACESRKYGSLGIE